MCGRFTLTLTADPADLFDALGVEPPAELRPRFNIAPTQSVLVARNRDEREASSGDGARELAWLHWGLIPSWAKDPKMGSRMINARSETASQKPSFRSAFKRRRCLLLADGFYEWKKEGQGPKQPYHVHRSGYRPMTFAGLWERWSKGPEPIESVTILTTSPNETMRPLHDRMPVILQPADWPLWLDRGVAGGEQLEQLMRPYESDDLEITAVSRLVNRPANDVPACIQPLDSSP